MKEMDEMESLFNIPKETLPPKKGPRPQTKKKHERHERHETATAQQQSSPFSCASMLQDINSKVLIHLS